MHTDRQAWRYAAATSAHPDDLRRQADLDNAFLAHAYGSAEAAAKALDICLLYDATRLHIPPEVPPASEDFP